MSRLGSFVSLTRRVVIGKLSKQAIFSGMEPPTRVRAAGVAPSSKQKKARRNEFRPGFSIKVCA
jgi:hypothetical protein